MRGGHVRCTLTDESGGKLRARSVGRSRSDQFERRLGRQFCIDGRPGDLARICRRLWRDRLQLLGERHCRRRLRHAARL